MSLTTRIAEDMKTAMKQRDKTTLETLRSLRAAILEFEKKKIGSTPTDEDDLAILTSAAKKRREAIEQYSIAGREDLRAQEQRELDVIMRYMPEQIDDDELKSIVHKAIQDSGAVDMKDIGRVMGPLMQQLKGRVDGNRVQALVRAMLEAPGA